MKAKNTKTNLIKKRVINFKKQLITSGKISILLVVCFFGKELSAQTTVTIKDSDLGSSTYRWTNDNIYLLDGFVFLESGGALIIQEGTVIKGIAKPTTGDNASALIIASGATINAIGTTKNPIIFTSEIDDLTDPSDLTVADRGLWGGLIILGDGVLGNTSATSNIEGIPTSETRSKFGGTDNTNNAGILKYVSIRHGGAELAPGDEINGLTLGGVGSGTTIEYVEVLANSDDGIEIFGGAVNIKHAVTAFCSDDGFDWDLGWVGKGQFWFVIQATDNADNGGEWDGAKPDNNSVFSNPTIYNATFIGSGTSGVSAKNTNAILMRDATAGTIANSIFTEYANKAMEVEDLPSSKGTDSYTRLQNGKLQLLNNVWFGFGSYSTFDANPTTGVIRYTSGGDDTTCADLISHLTTNNNLLIDPMLNSISRVPNGQLDPRPKSDSPVLSGLANYPSDQFFTSVSYKGAFNQVGTSIWLSGWSVLDEYGYLNVTSSIENSAQINRANLNIYPNPTSDIINIECTRKNDEIINLELYDIYGKKIANNISLKSNNKVELNVSTIASGIYMLKVNTETSNFFKKIIVK